MAFFKQNANSAGRYPGIILSALLPLYHTPPKRNDAAPFMIICGLTFGIYTDTSSGKVVDP